jgi:uncharacterized protein YjiS (DUF1127 family)
MIAASFATRWFVLRAAIVATSYLAGLGRRRKLIRDSRALAAMDERILRDIGLSRVDIAAKSSELRPCGRDS